MMIGKRFLMAKFEVEPFDGKNNFSLYTVKDIMVQQELIKAANQSTIP